MNTYRSMGRRKLGRTHQVGRQLNHAKVMAYNAGNIFKGMDGWSFLSKY